MNNILTMKSRGSVMVEMAGAIALLTFLVFGITELGRALYQLNMINKTAISGSRYMARTPDIIGSPTASPPCAVGAGWGDAVIRAVNMVTYGNEAGTGQPLLNGMSVTIDEPVVRTFTVDTDTHSDCVIQVHAEAPFQSLFGDNIYPPLFGGGDAASVILKADAEDRYLRIYYAPAAP